MLLDTNILSELMRPRPFPAVMEWLDTQPVDQLFTSAVTLAEIELGIALLPEGRRKADLYFAARKMFTEFTDRCLPFNDLAAQQYGQLVAARIAIGRPISVEDAQIAAIAIAHKLPVVTRNIKDFNSIDHLKLINPWELS